MEIGIAFPKLMPANKGDLLLEWAIRAEAGPFSSLAQIDRLVYGNNDVLIVMAAAAAVTHRVRLMPTVLIAPLRGAALIAKQVASIDSISGGRFVLGMGVGSRPDDFTAAGAKMERRGKAFEEQITAMRRIWAGEEMQEGVGRIGPPPARPRGPEPAHRRAFTGGAGAFGAAGRWVHRRERWERGVQSGAGGHGLLPGGGGCVERGRQAGEAPARGRADVRLGRLWRRSHG